MTTTRSNNYFNRVHFLKFISNLRYKTKKPHTFIEILNYIILHYKKVYNKKNTPLKTNSNRTEEEATKIILENNIDLVLNVPCGKMKNFIANVPEEIMLSISRESVGIGIAAGAYLAGGKPLLLIQNTFLKIKVLLLVELSLWAQLRLRQNDAWTR